MFTASVRLHWRGRRPPTSDVQRACLAVGASSATARNADDDDQVTVIVFGSTARTESPDTRARSLVDATLEELRVEATIGPIVFL